jgi:Putative transposase/Transposase zinc-binding domain
VTTLNEIFRCYGPTYRDHAGAALSVQQRRVMAAIEACRTAALGGQVFTCPACQTTRYSYHSCRNRHCPTCQQDASQAWLEEQQALLLPVPYFLITFTLPAPLRNVAHAHQAQVYDCMFRASAAALQQLAGDPRFLGGQLGMLGVLQTWTRDLRYHPHIHYLVPGVGVAPDGRLVFPPSADFLIHVRPLAALWRAKLRAALRQTPYCDAIAADVWQQDWVVDCRPVGRGEAALKYLAPYIFRVALSNNRILRVADDQVTFRYTHSDSGETRTRTLPAETFIDRFLEHVLPKGFVKVRYYGLFRPGNRAVLKRIRAQLLLMRGLEVLRPSQGAPAPDACARQLATCPSCGGLMQGRVLLPTLARAPPASPWSTAPAAQPAYSA